MQKTFRELVFENLLPNAIRAGVPYDKFWHMTPKVIGMYIDVYSERQKEKYKMIEYIPWLVGKYVVDAIGCTFGKGEFPNNPLSEENNNEMVNSNTETELTEEEKIKQTEQLFLKLRIMGANFNLNKNNKDDSE